MSKHIIVGAGLNGLFTAYYLMQAGEKVILLDQGDIGKESSWAGGGILSPLYPWRFPAAVTEIASWGQQRYPQIISDLDLQTGLDSGYIQSGLLMLDTTESVKALNWAKKYSHSIKLLNREEHEETFSQVNCNFRGGILMSRVGQVRNPRLVKTLQMSLIAGGVTIFKHEKCLKLTIKNHQIVGITTNKQQLNSESVILCTGAWLKSLLPESTEMPFIEPVKGQMLLLQSQPDLIKNIVLGDSHYIIPRKDGLVLVGSTLEHVGFDKSTTRQAKETLLAAAYSLVPKLQDARFIRQWSGLRPGSKRGIPTICSHPEINGLFINSGQYRNGVVMAPGSGNLMANLVLQRTPMLDCSPYKFASTAKLDVV